MKLFLRRLFQFVRDTPPVDFMSPPDPPEWEREMRQIHGLSEIRRATEENFEHGRVIGYTWTFGEKKKTTRRA